jgi:hypothetical protein
MRFELRPAALCDRTLGQLLGALAETARARSSPVVRLEIKGDHVLPERVTMSLHRIVQEAINNAVEHAKATTICEKNEEFFPFYRERDIRDDGMTVTRRINPICCPDNAHHQSLQAWLLDHPDDDLDELLDQEDALTSVVVMLWCPACEVQSESTTT